MHSDWRPLARAITRAENLDLGALAEMAKYPLDNSGVHVIGVTGPPGAGKSTLCNLLIQRLAKDSKVAALLIDPSSPYSGGAILGDRIRMQALADNPNIYIRSLSNRGNTGGVSRSVVGILRLLMNHGFQYIVIETIGAGQSEVKIASIADTTLVVTVPNLGDDIQAFKSGILEIADILVINKADLPGVDALYTALKESALKSQDGWTAQVCQTIALRDQGIDELVASIHQHRAWLDQEGRLIEKRKATGKFEIMELSSFLLQKHLDQLPSELLAANLTREDFNFLQRLDEFYEEILNSLG